MAMLSIPNVRIAGISACVPKKEVDNMDYKWISRKERELFIQQVGVRKRRVVDGNTTAADLCFTAAEKLIADLRWDKNEIEAIILVTQSGDYVIPASSIILQDRLGLSHNCLAFDINLGCSGYVYGLSVIGSMITSGNIKKALLLVGDTSTFNASYRDKSTYPLFGDAGTASAIEYSEGYPEMSFNLQSDGSGYKAIYVHDGGVRNFVSKDTLKQKKISDGIYRNKLQLTLDGIKVFGFSLREVVPNIKTLAKHLDTNIDQYDYFVFHQANRIINQTLIKMLKVPSEKMPLSLGKYGNTSSASIPMTIVSELGEDIRKKNLNLMLSGFGVGLSWGSAVVKTDKIVCPEVIEI
ncbi:MAG: ketoacyl-ACP synthase III [Bacteroidales bacterium]|nr:ketoacyl-ACP synthase III [Bacteroidales bacterium]